MKSLLLIYITLFLVVVGGLVYINKCINERVTHFKHSQGVLNKNVPVGSSNNDFMNLGAFGGFMPSQVQDTQYSGYYQGSRIER